MSRDLSLELSQLPYVEYFDDVQLSDVLNERPGTALLVACSDMGGTLPYVCSDPEANLLIFQDFGHRTSQHGISSLLASGSIEHLIVYGHSNCEFLKYLVGESLHDDSANPWLKKALQFESAAAVKQFGSSLDSCSQMNWQTMGELTVLTELKCSLLYPGVRAKAESLQLRLHAWMYSDEEQKLLVFDPNQRSFVQARGDGVKPRGACGRL